MKNETLEMIKEMGSINEPFELFEPYIWKDKIGDSLWHCEIRSVDCVINQGTGRSLEEAVKECYLNSIRCMQI